MTKQKILIVDDEPTQARLVESLLTTLGYNVQTARDGFDALKILGDEKANEISAVLLDLMMPRKGGLQVMEEAKALHPHLPFVVMTANGTVNTVIEVMRAGASDFIVKPVSGERLQVSLQNALKVSHLTSEIQKLKRKNDNRLLFEDLVAESVVTKAAITMAKRAAGSSIPVLIDGESGVGKEVMARAIQGESQRSGKPFVAVNCGAIPENLVESILFGHEKGAFTGAVDRHIGRFQEADGGTLFLDEVGELKLDIQVKLLRALQEGEIDAVGGKKPIKVNVRLISATNKNLAHMVEEGKFREDLFYRLNVFQLTLPPLRERREDIPRLVQHFIRKLSLEEGKPISGISEVASQILEAYHWPGNIRQLENMLFRAVVLAEESLLQPHDFPSILKALEARSAFSEGRVLYPLRREDDRLAEKLEASTVKRRRASDQPSSETMVSVVDTQGKVRLLKEIEEDVLRVALKIATHQSSEAAEALGIEQSKIDNLSKLQESAPALAAAKR